MPPPLHLHYTVGTCSLGPLLAASSEKGVCAILLGEEDLVADLRRRFPKARLAEGCPWFEKVRALVDGEACDFPMEMHGTDFQRTVWRELMRIPAGSTVSYGELARRIGRPTAFRAVARACGANPLSVVVPCHRVVASDGGLGGYRWGIERKRALISRDALRGACRRCQ